MGSGGMGERSPSVDTDALISGMVSKRVGDRPRMGDVTASDIYGGSFALGEIDLGMPTREQVAAADGAVVERIRSQLSPSISGGDIDEAVAGMVSERAPRSGGIPSLSTAPQRGAGGRPFDFNIDLGMPTREQVIMADRAAVAGIRSKLSPSLGSIDASDIDRSIAGMVSERAPRSGGIPDLFGTDLAGQNTLRLSPELKVQTRYQKCLRLLSPFKQMPVILGESLNLLPEPAFCRVLRQVKLPLSFMITRDQHQALGKAG